MNFGTRTLKSVLNKVRSMSKEEYKRLNKEASCCYGFGLWAIGDACPMGPMDARDGMPTIPCPVCKCDANPIKPARAVKPKKKKKKNGKKV